MRQSSTLRASAAALLVLALGQILGRTADAWADVRSLNRPATWTDIWPEAWPTSWPWNWSVVWSEGWVEGWTGGGSGPPPGAVPARVIEVIDGDTLVIEGGEHVRLLGIDSPEIHHPAMPGPQALGPEAAARLESLVGGHQVRLEADRLDRDHFGRLLRHVWIGRRLAAETLAREGLAHVLIIPPNQAHAADLRGAAASAQAGELGLWGLARPTPLPLFRLAPPATTPSAP